MGPDLLMLLTKISGRLVAFFFLDSLLILFFYLAGNSQQFLDRTQLFLLQLLQIGLVMTILLGVYHGVLQGVQGFRTGSFSSVPFLLALLAALLAFGLAVVFEFLTAWF